MRVLYITLFVILSDQLSKIFIKGIQIPFLGINITGMQYGDSIKVIGDFFKITFVENPGMAFGIDVNEISKLFLSLFSIVASIGIVIYLYRVRNKNLALRASLALILGGAIGNLIDRLFYGIIFDYAPLFFGKVVDFLNVDFFDFTLFGHTYDRWPIFNIADSSVTIGVLILLIFNKSIEKSNDAKSVVANTAPESVENFSSDIQTIDEIDENTGLINNNNIEQEIKPDEPEISNRETDKN